MKRKPYLKRRSSELETKPQQSVLEAILQHPAVPLTLGTALLYLVGQVHYASYLSYWGLSGDLFPLAKDQSIISGFFRSLQYSITMLPNMLLAMIGLGVVMLTVLVSTYRPFVERISGISSRMQTKAVTALRKYVAITRVHDKLMDVIALINNWAMLIVLLLASVVFPCAWAAKRGTEDARKAHLDILAGKESGKQFSAKAVLQVKTDVTAFAAYSGQLIQTSATHVALYDKDRGMLIFPLASVARIEIPEQKPGAKK